MYTHMVVFDLKTGVDSPETRLFLSDAGRILPAIPGVKDFRIRRQVSPKNDFTYCFSMEFDSDADFRAYLAHPSHAAFVAERWDAEVARFQEIDLC